MLCMSLIYLHFVIYFCWFLQAKRSIINMYYKQQNKINTKHLPSLASMVRVTSELFSPCPLMLIAATVNLYKVLGRKREISVSLVIVV